MSLTVTQKSLTLKNMIFIVFSARNGSCVMCDIFFGAGVSPDAGSICTKRLFFNGALSINQKACFCTQTNGLSGNGHL